MKHPEKANPQEMENTSVIPKGTGWGGGGGEVEIGKQVLKMFRN